MANVTYAILGEMAGTGGASEEVVKMMDKLPPSVRREVGESLVKDVDRVQILSFAPEAVVGDLKEVQSLQELANSLEKVLKKAIQLYDKSDLQVK